MRQEYPRPDFIRDDWLSLNGSWDFNFDDNDLGIQDEWYRHGFPSPQTIKVPFAYQCELSGIGTDEVHPIVWYARSFQVPTEWDGQRVLLNFGAVDYICTIWINGRLAGGNKGGYTSFSVDTTKFLQPGDNHVVLRVVDEAVTSQPRGKQRARKENFGCWYTPITGIWQSVWLEAVGRRYLEHVKLESNIYDQAVNIAFWLDDFEDGLVLECDVSEAGKVLSTVRVPLTAKYTFFSDVKSRKDGALTLSIPGGKLWTPENPYLYDLHFRLFSQDKLVDSVKSYVGLRKVHKDGGQIFVNDEPIYLRMVLDQGYWPGGIYTPQSIEEIAQDVRITKELGFNGARKHQKFEDPYYYYYCDKAGLLVWCEMPSPYIYDEEVSQNMTEEWQRLVRQHYNHPSVIAWVPLNESWGVDQLKEPHQDKRSVYHMLTLYNLTKSLDTTRLVIGNDGWQQAQTDIVAIHDYTQDPNDFREKYAQFRTNRHTKAFTHGFQIILDGYEYTDQPIMVTEFGGIKIADEDEASWGYGEAARSQEEYLTRIRCLVDAILAEDEICGYCYTQLTDVEQEVNGLLTMDRKPKVDIKDYAEIFRGR